LGGSAPQLVRILSVEVVLSKGPLYWDQSTPRPVDGRREMMRRRRAVATREGPMRWIRIRFYAG